MARTKKQAEVEAPIYKFEDGKIIIARDKIGKIVDLPEIAKEIQGLKVLGFPVVVVEPEVKPVEKPRKRAFRIETAQTYLDNGGVEAKKAEIDGFKAFAAKIKDETAKYEKAKEAGATAEELAEARSKQQKAIVAIRKAAAAYFKDTFGKDAYDEVLNLSR